MQLRNPIADFTPALLIAVAIGLLTAVLTFGVIFMLTSTLALGLDFFIIVGVVMGGTVGIGSSIVTFRMIRSRISN